MGTLAAKATVWLGLTLVASCTGAIGEAPAGSRSEASGAPPGPGPEVDTSGLPGAALAARGRLRRLTVDEYSATVLQLFEDTASSASQLLPNDARSPFDNDYTKQGVDSALVTGVELLAGDIVDRFLADKPRRDRIIGCSAADTAGLTDDRASKCLRDLIARLGRLAWRRTLTDEDIASLMKFQSLARQDGDFYSAVDAVLRALLQDPEFLFRVEVGAPIGGGLFKLTGPEMATRLAYFLWGRGPDQGLLDVAEGGGLDTAEKVRRAASGMLESPAAVARFARFHALWMGYERLPASALAKAMKAETDALISRVIFEKKLPWQELLRHTETYVNYDLAKHYGLGMVPPTLKPRASTAAWVPYAGTRRQGLFSHASFLQLGVKTGNTHPVLRGKGIRELLFCQEFPPKPANVTPAMRTDSPCTRDYLKVHAQGACAGCHALFDPVGLGLENYDAEGKYRSYDSVTLNPALANKSIPAGRCPISGDGDLDGKPFNGPAGLADLMLADPRLNPCTAKRLYQFAMGVGDGIDPSTGLPKLDDTDRQFLDLLAKRMGSGDFDLDRVLLDFVSSGAFAHRREGT